MKKNKKLNLDKKTIEKNIGMFRTKGKLLKILMAEKAKEKS